MGAAELGIAKVTLDTENLNHRIARQFQQRQQIMWQLAAAGKHFCPPVHYEDFSGKLKRPTVIRSIESCLGLPHATLKTKLSPIHAGKDIHKMVKDYPSVVRAL